MADMIHIHDGNFRQHVQDPVIDGERKARGLVPRNLQQHPVGSYGGGTKFDMPVIQQADWSGLIRELEASKSRLSDLRESGGPGGGRIPARDQNGRGYCHPAGTPILMVDGSEKPIERIEAGDQVITHANRPQRVIGVSRRRYSGGLSTLWVENGRSITATDEHPLNVLHAPQQFNRLVPAFIENGRVWGPARAVKPWDCLVCRSGQFTEPRIVTGVRRESADLDVFNFEVEADHSYLAGGFVSHNCWAHSGTGAMLLVRARDGQPYADLSAYAVACIIKSYADEGGWGAQGVDFMRERGIPTAEFWPQRGVNRSYDKPETWKNAALHRFTDGWWDLDSAEYDRNLSFQQVITCLLLRIPVVVDYNWWSHSIVAMDAIDGASQWGVTRADSGKLLSREQFDFIWGMGDPVTAGTGVLILNSWGDSWSQNGAGVLSGSKAVPDGSVAPRITTASAA